MIKDIIIESPNPDGMSENFADTYRYALEKFDNAADLLDMEGVSIRQRLENAASELNVLRSGKHIPEMLRPQFDALKSAFVQRGNLIREEGSIATTIGLMSDHEIASCVQHIREIHNRLLKDSAA